MQTVLAHAADGREAHGLIRRLHIELLPSIKAALPLESVIGEIEEELHDRAAAINQFYAEPGATASTVVTKLLQERSKTTPSAQTPDLRPGAPIEAAREAIERRLSGSQSQPFREMKALVEKADILTEAGQRDALAAGFDGRVPLAVRVLTSTREEGDVHVKFDPVFSTLSDLRSELLNYFNYLYRVQIEGTPPNVVVEVPKRMKPYCIGESNTNRPLLDALLALKLTPSSTVDWVAAPYGVMGRQMCLQNRSTPDVHDPRDYFCQPELLTDVCEFLHIGLRGMGCADKSTEGFTMITLGEFFVKHLKLSVTLETDEAAYRWANRASNKFQLALQLVGENLRGVLRSQSLDKNLNTYVLPFDSEATHELREAEAMRRRKLEEEKEDPIFKKVGPSRSPGLPLLSQCPKKLAEELGIAAPSSAKKKTGGKRRAEEEPVDTPVGKVQKPGSLQHLTKWLGDANSWALLVSGDVWNVKPAAAAIGADLRGTCWESVLPAVSDPANRFSRCRHWGKPGHESETSSAHKITLSPGKREELKAKFSRPATPQETALMKQAKLTADAARAPSPGGRGRARGRARAPRGGRRGRTGGRHNEYLEWDPTDYRVAEYNPPPDFR